MNKIIEQAHPTSQKKSRLWLIAGLVSMILLPLSFGLASVSNDFESTIGWQSFLVAGIIGVIVLSGGWVLIQRDSPPQWLAILVVSAALIRLAAGVIWYLAVPVWGHGSEAELKGYVMSDASKRDRAAWELGSSTKSLFSAFQNRRAADQYGGLLFISALVYRFLGGPTHNPLLIVVLTAAFSSLAVFFTWGLARLAWGERVATLAAWFITLFPEAVLLGSSQMREAFTVTLSTAAFYGLLRYHQKRSWDNLAIIGLSLLLYLPFSPPFTALLLGMIILTGLAFVRSLPIATRSRWIWAGVIALVVLVLIGVWFTLSQFVPDGMVNPVEILSWYLRKSAEYQARITRLSSGWLQKTFKTTPGWTHIPIVISYGTLQPFLPAALTVGSHAPVWPGIVLWRSIGWTIVLGLLLYAPLLAFRPGSASNFTRIICLVVWLSILIAAYRGGGDMWDNPRYRSAFSGIQLSLAAWAWVEHRRTADPWLRRAFIGLVAILVWFVPWYLRRYTGFNWPVISLFQTLGLGIASAMFLILLEWGLTRLKT